VIPTAALGDVVRRQAEAVDAEQHLTSFELGVPRIRDIAG
jgi:hypothetical protein